MRIHFTLSDLARTRLAAVPSPLAAATFSAYRLRDSSDAPALDLWRRAVRRDWKPGRQRLFGILAARTPTQPVPRFLRPHEGLLTLEEELDQLRSTPRSALRADLAYVAEHRALPSWTRALADGDREALDMFAEAARAYHQVAIAPYWHAISSQIAVDQALRLRQFREGGIERVLSSLHPLLRWRPPVLETAGHPDDVVGEDYHLGGRGLVLAPAAFCSYVPCDPADEQPTLYYEAAAHPPLASLTRPYGGPADPADPRGELAALLGHSRAAVLEVIADGVSGVSTGQLARRVGLSPASASEHTAVLRRAGLVATHRSGRTAHHSPTPLGSELLRGAVAPATDPATDPRPDPERHGSGPAPR
ncbi:winged helix-turn-helix domain-containing protein [Streptomyces sp. NBC_01186]|uniref:winged helix-turn-helix domain-containing protein n=1 Tax=Streptomyces sp. NBC_01186 TaxID=2903765 RepID=UPI002E1586D6|nr:winged helix-turn-helix domain-containing protein [Streptomyces sp. NBC_01186]